MMTVLIGFPVLGLDPGDEDNGIFFALHLISHLSFGFV
jgi:hypothetical protein